MSVFLPLTDFQHSEQLLIPIDPIETQHVYKPSVTLPYSGADPVGLRGYMK